MRKFLKGILGWILKEPPITAATETFTETTSQLVAAGTAVDLYTLTVPSRCSMQLIGFGNNSLVWGTVYWEILVDGLSAYPRTARIYDQIGLESGRQAFQNINVLGGHTLTIRATNPSAADCMMGMALEYVLFYPN